jgi:hypothetical protein
MRVLQLTVSIPLLVVTLLIVALVLFKFVKVKHYIPLFLSVYGGLFCWGIQYFAYGYSGIVFVLISWVFIISGVISIAYIAFRHFSLL